MEGGQNEVIEAEVVLAPSTLQQTIARAREALVQSLLEAEVGGRHEILLFRNIATLVPGILDKQPEAGRTKLVVDESVQLEDVVPLEKVPLQSVNQDVIRDRSEE